MGEKNVWSAAERLFPRDNALFDISQCKLGLTFQLTSEWHNFRLEQIETICNRHIDVDQKINSVLRIVESIVRKRESASYLHFLLFQQCFQKKSLSGLLKWDCFVTACESKTSWPFFMHLHQKISIILFYHWLSVCPFVCHKLSMQTYNFPVSKLQTYNFPASKLFVLQSSYLALRLLTVIWNQ